MRLRSSKYLILAVLVLFCFQLLAGILVSASLGQAESYHHNISFQKHHSTSSLISLFEKTEKENEEEERDKSLSVPLHDFTISFSERLFSLRSPLQFNAISQHAQEPSLRVLHCTFTI